ncbi:MAG: gliding motility-associated ABC transporter permease subunit GldF [Bacteroidales bacterium]|jgi:ABC-2 type transport system permease protein|nr:gliding motility-associated ABC transporter permease subunit GldF [Bacteroidales bacterium]
MLYLLKKEIQSFFSSLTGYLVIIVFLAVTGLCLWVFPGVLNIPESGYASLESLFYIAPWVFLFLAPAITMRSFSEEKKSGTIELLLTRPISELQIVLAKFLAAVVLIIISLLPCLVYIFSVWKLGNPPGNLDTGATYGALIGLLLLGGIYAAIGTFTSSLTDNQVVAFILAAAGCFIFYEGFDALSGLFSSGTLQDIISWFGIKRHYASISRGVVDSRDLIYFFGIMLVFILFTRLKLQSRKWK